MIMDDDYYVFSVVFYVVFGLVVAIGLLADIALRVTGTEAEEKVEHHEPLIRNQLVMLFSAQTSETINAPDGRENLRLEALKKVQDAINGEEGKPIVEDLLFNNLIIQ